MNFRRKRIYFGTSITVATLFVLLLCYYAGRGVFFAYKYDPGKASTTRDVAQITSLSPPPAAHDIRVASYMRGQAWSDFVRFSAPVDVCCKYAALLAKKPLEPVDDTQVGTDIMVLRGNFCLFGNLNWFDLPYARNAWTMAGNKIVYHEPKASSLVNLVAADYESSTGISTSVRVDISRGIFYFYDWH